VFCWAPLELFSLRHGFFVGSFPPDHPFYWSLFFFFYALSFPPDPYGFIRGRFCRPTEHFLKPFRWRPGGVLVSSKKPERPPYLFFFLLANYCTLTPHPFLKWSWSPHFFFSSVARGVSPFPSQFLGDQVKKTNKSARLFLRVAFFLRTLGLGGLPSFFFTPPPSRVTSPRALLVQSFCRNFKVEKTATPPPTGCCVFQFWPFFGLKKLLQFSAVRGPMKPGWSPPYQPCFFTPSPLYLDTVPKRDPGVLAPTKALQTFGKSREEVFYSFVVSPFYLGCGQDFYPPNQGFCVSFSLHLFLFPLLKLVLGLFGRGPNLVSAFWIFFIIVPFCPLVPPVFRVVTPPYVCGNTPSRSRPKTPPGLDNSSTYFGGNLP